MFDPSSLEGDVLRAESLSADTIHVLVAPLINSTAHRMHGLMSICAFTGTGQQASSGPGGSNAGVIGVDTGCGFDAATLIKEFDHVAQNDDQVPFLYSTDDDGRLWLLVSVIQSLT